MTDDPQHEEPASAPNAPRRQERPQAVASLDKKGEALAGVLQEILQPYQPVMTIAVNQPVVKVPLEHLVKVAELLKEDPRLDFDYFRCLATVDYLEFFELVYPLYSTKLKHQALLKTTTTYELSSAPSLISIWPAAEWHERESHDLFGVVFDGNPNLQPLLIYEGFEGYPGRKSFPFHDYEDW